jgi:hypothetical protein
MQDEGLGKRRRGAEDDVSPRFSAFIPLWGYNLSLDDVFELLTMTSAFFIV